MGVCGLREIAHRVLLLQSPFKTHVKAPPPGRCVVVFQAPSRQGHRSYKKAFMHHWAGSTGLRAGRGHLVGVEMA
jgi:hypothetical protein